MHSLNMMKLVYQRMNSCQGFHLPPALLAEVISDSRQVW